MNRPDYLIIGAMKCGTSTLAAQLGAQPGIFMTDPKEPNYFSDDDVFENGPEWYADLFRTAHVNDVKGEASTHYAKRPDYPLTLSRMTKALPSPRLVYMIRNPIERLVSHYIHAWSLSQTEITLDEMMRSNATLIDYGRYGWQIQPFIEAYGPDAVLLTSLEKLKKDPATELARVAEHIGFSGSVNWIEDMGARNVSSERMRKFPLQRLLIDNGVARALRRTLVPKSVRNRIRSTHLMTERPEISESELKKLQSIFLEDKQLLEQFFPQDESIPLVYAFD